MNKHLFILLAFPLLMAGCYSSQQATQSDYADAYYERPVTYDAFYSQLSPYGTWTNYSGYGNVWIPAAGAGFRPYETGGHWVSTVDGWAWASDYNWGWAPFHYGRWFYEPAVGGWAWVPGYQWAPAWVQWGQYSNFYAWAPLAPGINVGYGNSWMAPANYWSAVPCNYMGSANINRHVVRSQQVVNNVTVINNYNSTGQSTTYNKGPEYKDVETKTGRQIRPVAIAPTTKPGATKVSKQEMEVYRPDMSPKSQASNAGSGKETRQPSIQRATTTTDRNNTGAVIDNTATLNVQQPPAKVGVRANTDASVQSNTTLNAQQAKETRREQVRQQNIERAQQQRMERVQQLEQQRMQRAQQQEAIRLQQLRNQSTNIQIQQRQNLQQNREVIRQRAINQPTTPQLIESGVRRRRG